MMRKVRFFYSSVFNHVTEIMLALIPMRYIVKFPGLLLLELISSFIISVDLDQPYLSTQHTNVSGFGRLKIYTQSPIK